MIVFKTQSPQVSIVVPVFNAASHIEECLNCIIASDFESFEIIVVDDASSDDTLKKLVCYPIQIFKNESNAGAAASRNRGIDMARGDIILLLDSDVLIPPDLIKKSVDFLIKHPEVDIVQGGYSPEPYYLNLFSQYKHLIFSFRAHEAGGTYINYVHTCCVATKKFVFKKIRFDEHLKRREDIDFGLRCSEAGFKIYADNNLLVRHKKKNSFFDFCKYQFKSAQEIACQQLIMRNDNFKREYVTAKQSLYKRLWVLRPVWAFCLIGAFAVFMTGNDSAWSVIVFILISSFFLEFPFRIYLFKNASIFLFLAAFPFYFLDGFLLGCGIIAAVLQKCVAQSGIRKSKIVS